MNKFDSNGFDSLSSPDTPDTQDTVNLPDITPKTVSYIEHDGNKYYPYTSDFTDEDEKNVRLTFHFRAPQRTHMVQISKQSKEKAFDAQIMILDQLVLPSERGALKQALEKYLALVGSFGDEVFKKAGAGSVFAGK